jgi:hypothetical protein
MKKQHLLITLLILGHVAMADPNLEGLGVILTVASIGLLSTFVLLFAAINRFTRKDYKVSKPLNIASIALIISALTELLILGSQIDSGFFNTCISAIAVSALLIILNYSVGNNSKAEGQSS